MLIPGVPGGPTARGDAAAAGAAGSGWSGGGGDGLETRSQSEVGAEIFFFMSRASSVIQFPSKGHCYYV